MRVPFAVLCIVFLGNAQETEIKTKEETLAIMEQAEHRNMTAVMEKLKKLKELAAAKVAEEEKPVEEQEEKEGQVEQEVAMRIAYSVPKQRDHIGELGDSIFEVNNRSDVNSFTFQGDVVYTEEQLDRMIQEQNGSTPARKRRQAYRDSWYPQTIWPGNTVYYYFHSSCTANMKAVVNSAIKVWQQNTCINFKYSTTAANRIQIFKGQGCWSYIGKIGGVQSLSLGTGCHSVGTAAHELGHALGYFHEQSRVDRNSWITVKYGNIQDGWADQFQKETHSTNYNYKIPYDYGGIMHYGGTSASGNGQPTMVAKMAWYQDTMGSDMVSFYDISMMNAHYKCKAKCPAKTSAKCKNGGFPHPRNCKRCVCPSGYGGWYCNKKPGTCGKTLYATSSYKTLYNRIGDGKYNVKANFAKCNYWIVAPKGKRIQLQIKWLAGPSTEGCVYGGVEIKSHKDQKRTGYRFCDKSDKGKTFWSTGRYLPIITFNRYFQSTTQLLYRWRN